MDQYNTGSTQNTSTSANAVKCGLDIVTVLTFTVSDQVKYAIKSRCVKENGFVTVNTDIRYNNSQWLHICNSNLNKQTFLTFRNVKLGNPTAHLVEQVSVQSPWQQEGLLFHPWPVFAACCPPPPLSPPSCHFSSCPINKGAKSPKI